MTLGPGIRPAGRKAENLSNASGAKRVRAGHAITQEEFLPFKSLVKTKSGLAKIIVS